MTTMIEASAAPWYEPMHVAARRVRLRAEMRERVVGPHVIEALRQARDQRLAAAPALLGTDTVEAGA
jgi:hypothetical protein